RWVWESMLHSKHHSGAGERADSMTPILCVTVIYIPLMILGLLGNILTILVVWLRPHMRTCTYLYLSSMAVSDLLILLLLPLDLYQVCTRPRPWLLGDLVCKLTMFLSECCTFCTILHITFLSLERYLAVCWPITSKTLVTRRRTKVVIGCLWLGAAISAAPVLVMVGVEEVQEDVGFGGWRNDTLWTDMDACRWTLYATSSGLISAMLILSNLYFLVPFCILGLVYTLIGRTLWLRPQSNHRDQSLKNTIKMLGVIVLAFVLCWLPFHVGRTIFFLSFGTASESSALGLTEYNSTYFNYVSSVLFYLSPAINPLLYNLMSGRYRLAVRSLLHSESPAQIHRTRTFTIQQPSTAV
uniref:Growth hormone secretagogue receptor type 1 n=1 Tax=Neogobius melanostomus TaxID=47308 RepID=A0A8C6T0Q2_9GOBI